MKLYRKSVSVSDEQKLHLHEHYDLSQSNNLLLSRLKLEKRWSFHLENEHLGSILLLDCSERGHSSLESFDMTQCRGE